MYTSVGVNDGCVAQLVEHLTFNQRVWGSNPQWLTNVSASLFGLRIFCYMI